MQYLKELAKSFAMDSHPAFGWFILLVGLGGWAWITGWYIGTVSLGFF